MVTKLDFAARESKLMPKGFRLNEIDKDSGRRHRLGFLKAFAHTASTGCRGSEVKLSNQAKQNGCSGSKTRADVFLTEADRRWTISEFGFWSVRETKGKA